MAQPNENGQFKTGCTKRRTLEKTAKDYETKQPLIQQKCSKTKKMVEKKKKKGRPEEENFNQETGLPTIFKSNYQDTDKKPFVRCTPAPMYQGLRTQVTMQ
jgi:hypothetical protein